MPQFSDDYFRDLPPRDRRYDTPVADQLVFSVFPNGVKAWVHVYPFEDYVRRRTIGLFPETGYEDALVALEHSRRIAAVDALETRRRSRPGSRGIRYFGVGLVAAVLAAVATYLAIDSAEEPPPPASAGQLSAPDSGPGDRADGEPARDAPAGDGAPGGDAAAADQPMEAVITDEESASPAQTDGTATAVAAAPSGTPDQTGEPPGEPTAGPAGDTIAPDASTGAGARDPAGPPSPETTAEPDHPVADSEPAPPPPEAHPDALPAHDGGEAGTEGAGATESAGPDSGPRSVRVSRSALAREIHEREPQGLITEVLEVPPGETVTVFLFTELKGMPGETVLHRWELNDQTVAEVPFRIGNGARWRVYSSKDIDSDGAGRWRAVVVDSLGNEIDAQSFEVRTEQP